MRQAMDCNVYLLAKSPTTKDARGDRPNVGYIVETLASDIDVANRIIEMLNDEGLKLSSKKFTGDEIERLDRMRRYATTPKARNALDMHPVEVLYVESELAGEVTSSGSAMRKVYADLVDKGVDRGSVAALIAVVTSSLDAAHVDTELSL